jgi:hypothetical protein
VPTYDAEDRFYRDYHHLTPEEVHAFRVAVRIHGVQGHRDVYELTWAPDGRATFAYGGAIRQGMPHIIWRRIGDHSIFDDP